MAAAAAAAANPAPPIDVGFPRTYAQHWVTGRQLGRGAFGVTCEAHRAPCAADCLDLPALAAVKIVPKARLASAADVAAIQREAAVMARLAPHRHIVALLGAFEDDADVYLVQTLCAGGELYARLVNGTAYAEADAARAMRALMDALAHAHQKVPPQAMRCACCGCARQAADARAAAAAGRLLPGREARESAV
jgi:hypothetical protein